MIKVLMLIRRVIRPSLQSGLLMGTGDVIAQTFVEKKKNIRELNLVRTGQFACMGLFLAGPVLSLWYGVLARRFGSTGGIATLKKVALDQCLFAPSFIFVFLSTLGTIQGDRPATIVSNIKKVYPDIIITNYKLWPGVQLINFYLIPLRHQVLLVQSVALVFNTYLSWKTQSNRNS